MKCQKQILIINLSWQEKHQVYPRGERSAKEHKAAGNANGVRYDAPLQHPQKLSVTGARVGEPNVPSKSFKRM